MFEKSKKVTKLIKNKPKKLFKKSKDFQSTSEDIFSFPLKLLLFTGFEFSMNSKKKLKSIFFWIGSLICVIQMGFHEIAFLKKPFELRKISFGTSSTASTFLYVILLLTFHFNRSEIFKILENIKKFFPTKNRSIFKIAKGFKCFVMFSTILCISMTFISFLLPFVKFFLFGNRNFLLPLPNLFFDPKSPEIYPVTLILSSALPLTGFYYGSVFIIMTMTIITGIGFQFMILAQEIRNFRNLSEEEIQEKFPKWIEKHNEVFENVKKFNEIFSVSFFLRFVTSGTIIAIQLFQLNNADGRNFSNIFVSAYFIFELIQIFVQCYFGQFLIDASESIAKVIYDCGWENWQNIKLKKLILIVLAKCQKPAKLRIWKFGNISMEQFTLVSSE
ncbi:hypothetical protein PVAND_014908 [Polypedilum vanderplanki]|uniref:Odorant receptor n=1 Tax=Polypedilum vanderplanki TaxID=319348 RepID=A0A9J6BB31_POLVA|nr:hypothetical protein PVAND_014908 [Polypedilum vanderplanki]